MLGSLAMPSQGEAAFTQTPGRMALLARQPSVSQPVQPAGMGAGGWMGELQEGDNARSLASVVYAGDLEGQGQLAEDRGSSARHVRARITVF